MRKTKAHSAKVWLEIRKYKHSGHFEVRKIMPGLTARGHGRLRMTEGPQVRFFEGG